MTYQESVLTPFTLHKRFYTANNHALAPRQTLSQKNEEKNVVDFYFQGNRKTWIQSQLHHCRRARRRFSGRPY